MALPVLVASLDQARQVVREFSEIGRRLAERFWPGPLTLVFSRSLGLPDLLTGGMDTVAVRMPDHWVPLALMEELGRPITGTSANLSGGGDLLTLDEVAATLGREVDYIIRCGPAPAGVASTVVDVTNGDARLLRQGALPFDEVLLVSRRS
jgi:L-threonylcarbamoyladenylate synthase